MSPPASVINSASKKSPLVWRRRNGYEVSSNGDSRFSAFYAKLEDRRSIECHYQCDVEYVK